MSGFPQVGIEAHEELVQPRELLLEGEILRERDEVDLVVRLHPLPGRGEEHRAVVIELLLDPVAHHELVVIVAGEKPLVMLF